MEMGTFRITTKDLLRITTAAMRAKVSRSEFIRRAALDAADRQNRSRAHVQ
jgi:hypothetical protein